MKKALPIQWRFSIVTRAGGMSGKAATGKAQQSDLRRLEGDDS
jgi:hypothetical protein